VQRGSHLCWVLRVYSWLDIHELRTEVAVHWGQCQQTLWDPRSTCTRCAGRNMRLHISTEWINEWINDKEIQTFNEKDVNKHILVQWDNEINHWIHHHSSIVLSGSLRLHFVIVNRPISIQEIRTSRWLEGIYLLLRVSDLRCATRVIIIVIIIIRLPLAANRSSRTATCKSSLFLSVPLLYHSMGHFIKSVFLSVYVCMYVCVCLWARLRSHFSTDLHEIW